MQILHNLFHSIFRGERLDKPTRKDVTVWLSIFAAFPIPIAVIFAAGNRLGQLSSYVLILSFIATASLQGFAFYWIFQARPIWLLAVSTVSWFVSTWVIERQF